MPAPQAHIATSAATTPPLLPVHGAVDRVARVARGVNATTTCAAPAATCAVLIHPTGPRPQYADTIALAEVELYDMAGVQLPDTTSSFQRSSVYALLKNPADTGARCNDKDASTVCTSNAGEVLPMLRVSYPCLGGSSSISRVVVVNRMSCCWDLISRFDMDFVDASGALDRPSYYFSEGVAEYSIFTATTGGGAWGLSLLAAAGGRGGVGLW